MTEVSTKFRNCLAQVLIFEEGDVNHPKDPGGKTSDGIIQTVYNAWRKKRKLPIRDVFLITEEEKEQIYWERYWSLLKCDEIPIGIDFVMFDYGVNSGVSRSIKHSQSLLGLKADGVIGPKTIAALNAIDQEDFIEMLCSKRMSFLKGLNIWEYFGKGWTRRVSVGRKFALGLVEGKTKTLPY